MKIKCYLTTILFIILSACSDKKNVKNDNSTLDEVYSFGMTTDPNFCSLDSVLEKECSYGNLFLTKKGNVILYFFCPNRDSSSFHIGTYKVSDIGITCSFNKTLVCPQCAGCPMKCLLHEGEIYEELLLTKPNCNELEYCGTSRKTRQSSKFLGFVYKKAHPNDDQAFRQLVMTSDYLKNM